MATNNHPVDYKYISQRLTRETVQQYEAARPRKRLPVSINLRVVEFQRQERSILDQLRHSSRMTVLVATFIC